MRYIHICKENVHLDNYKYIIIFTFPLHSATMDY